jgi:hypothetical protein
MRFEIIDMKLIVGPALDSDDKSCVSNIQKTVSHLISHISNLIKR